MKKALIFHFAICLLFTSCDRQNKTPIIDAISTNAQFKVEGVDKIYNWTISPDIDLDEFGVEISDNQSLEVGFHTDIDSIFFQIHDGAFQDFIVIVNKEDSAYTRIKSVPPKVNFTQDFILKNKGKSIVEVPKVKELLMIIFIITPTGIADKRSMIINHDSTEYYQSVLDHFLAFKDEPIVAQMDSMLQKNWFINLKADACAYVFDDNNNIVNSPYYNRMRGSSNLIEAFLTELNDFATKSGFCAFYQSHLDYYQSLINWQEEAISTQKQWDWLEQQFPDFKYDNYWITFSPLVKGNHSTVRFDQNGFKQAVMFTRPPYRVKNVSKNVSNGLITRFVFTEIDHNYVNPESDKYLTRINNYFKDLTFWTNGKESSSYNTAYTVFNEYMTWAVYLLYIYDNFPSRDFKIINEKIVNYKINIRGFHRFDDFNAELQRLYFERKDGTTVSDLYIPILNWAVDYINV